MHVQIPLANHNDTQVINNNYQEALQINRQICLQKLPQRSLI